MEYSQVRKKIIQSASTSNIPVFGEFELSPACNLACKMCYVRDNQNKQELTTEEWKKIIFEAKNKGLLFCLFTGGEIFLRSDFQEIYEFTYDLGIRISLFTNASLINDDIIEYLKKRKPEMIAITMYGVNAKMYEEITGSKLAFYQVEKAINKLKQANMAFVVRTIAIKPIYHNLDEVIKYFKEQHFSVSYSLYIGPRRDNLKLASNYRLTPEEVADFDYRFRKAFNSSMSIEKLECSSGFNCVAGKSSYFVTWDKFITPCAMLGQPKCKIEASFSQAWDSLVQKVAKVSSCLDCEQCSLNKICMQCPAKRYLEGGFDKCSLYLKAISESMKEKNHEKF